MANPEKRTDLEALNQEAYAYDPDMIAETVIWPFVYEVLPEGWEEEEKKNPEGMWLVRKQAFFDGSHVDIVMTVERNFEITPNNEFNDFTEVTLSCEEIKRGDARELIIANARADDTISEEDEDDDDHNEYLGDYEDSELIAKSSMVFSFDSLGDAQVCMVQQVDSPKVTRAWQDIVEEEGMKDDPAYNVFGDPELERLEAILDVLGASDKVYNALQFIKKPA
jgi:hypothetical protein